MDRVVEKKSATVAVKDLLQDFALEPQEVNSFLEQQNSAPINQKQRAAQLLLRPNINLKAMIATVPRLKSQLESFTETAYEQAEIQLKYDVYIEKEKDLVVRMNQLENLEIPNDFDYSKLVSISNEAREKLRKIRPQTLGQASRISGINPSDVQILMVFMGR